MGDDLFPQIDGDIVGSNLSMDNFIKDIKRQEIYDSYVAKIHSKLTLKGWNEHPDTVDVYCTFLKRIKEICEHVDIDPVKILPGALLLIDDFTPENKLKGLRSCMSILQCLEKDSFKSSNHQLVIFEALKKAIMDKDLNVLQSALDCMMLLLPMMPDIPITYRANQFDKFLKALIEDIYMETSIERKKLLFGFLCKFIEMRQLDCVRYKKDFVLMICENLDLCISENIRKVLMKCTLETLTTWLKYCWCAWIYDTDKKILALLFKLLYIECIEEYSSMQIEDLHNIIMLILSLCPLDPLETIQESLQAGAKKIYNKPYLEILKNLDEYLVEVIKILTNEAEYAKQKSEVE